MNTPGSESIDIPFSTNAVPVAAQVDKATQATRRATNETAKLEAAQRKLEQQSIKTANRMAAAFAKLGGIGGVFGKVTTSLGIGGGIGALGVGFVAAERAIAAATYAVTNFKRQVMEAVRAEHFLADAAAKARDMQAGAGAGAAKAQGANLLKLIGQGPDAVAQAGKLTTNFGATDAQAATLKARERFGDKAGAALDASARAASATGETLLAGVEKLNHVDLEQGTGAEKLFALQNPGGGSLSEAEARLAADPLAKGIRELKTQEGIGDGIAQGMIPQAWVAKAGENATLRDPAAKATLDAWNSQQRQIEVLAALNDRLGSLISVLTLDRVKYLQALSAPVGH